MGGSIPRAVVCGAVLLLGCPGSGSGNTAPADGGTDATTNGGTSGSSGTSGRPAPAPTTFGPDLAAPLVPPATANTYGCGAGYPVQTNPSFPQPFLASGAGSCLVGALFVDGNLPKAGTASSATIFVPGTVTGPMRFVRMRMLFPSTPGSPSQCCSLEQYGTEFTPEAGRTTTVQLGFPMTFDPLGQGNPIAMIDLIGLEVLDPTTPIPGFWKTNGGPDAPPTTTLSFMWLPALSKQEIKAPSSDLLPSQGSYSGFVPYFNFALVPK
jgi:hypothetical protein